MKTAYIITAANTVVQVKIVRKSRLNSKVKLLNGSKRLVPSANVFETCDEANQSLGYRLDGVLLLQIA